VLARGIALTSTAILALSATQIFAAVIRHDDRPLWESLFPTQVLTENFDLFDVDILVRSNPVQLAGFDMTATEGPLGDSSNKIDASPFFANTTVNSSTDFYGDVSPGAGEVEIVFDIPIVAWGANFIGTEATLIEIRNEAGQLVGNVSAVNGVDDTGPVVEFVGFVLTNGATAKSLFFTKGLPSGAGNDSWAMDDFSFVSIPEPTTFALLSIVFLFSIRQRTRPFRWSPSV